MHWELLNAGLFCLGLDILRSSYYLYYTKQTNVLELFANRFRDWLIGKLVVSLIADLVFAW